MPIVQISARISRWPEVCACCCRPADTTILVSATRTKGKRVIQTESKSWHVPYCSNCLEHIKVVQELKQFS
ncbi:MAG: hypothetical protein NZ703_03300, partial [Gemmataceae bacterium]|nr:hypothetical protein [Gemmataceae bacterium]